MSDPQRPRTLAAVALLGFSSGLPLALSGGTLEAWCAVSGLSLKTIGVLKVVAAAYVFKFLWAPLIDRYALPWLGRRRGWMLVMQIALALALMATAALSPATSLAGIAVLAVAIATFSATQDIAVDAYRADQMHPRDRGLGAALGVGGYRLAMLTSGGLALILADALGWRAMYLVMALVMAVGVAGTLIAPERDVAPPPRDLLSAYVEPFREFLLRSHAVAWLALMVLYKFGNAFALSLSTTYLLRGAGYTLTEVGWVNKVFALGATVAGVFIGGLVLERWPLWRALLLFGVLQALGNLGFVALSFGWTGMPALMTAVGLENLTSGLGTAAFVAMLMALCNTRFSATQYALFSALDSLARVFIGPLAGWTAESYGWPAYFIAATLSAAPGLLLLVALKPEFARLEQPRAAA